ncbi:hypothetical protein GOODEAATRI_004295, partial [Goodea atripinnis]
GMLRGTGRVLIWCVKRMKVLFRELHVEEADVRIHSPAGPTGRAELVLYLDQSRRQTKANVIGNRSSGMTVVLPLMLLAVLLVLFPEVAWTTCNKSGTPVTL